MFPVRVPNAPYLPASLPDSLLLLIQFPSGSLGWSVHHFDPQYPALVHTALPTVPLSLCSGTPTPRYE